MSKLFIGLLLFHWCALYSGARFSSENWSGLTLALGFLLWPLPRLDVGPCVRAKNDTLYVLLAGFLFGLSFLFRYQIGLMLVGLGAWLVIIGRERGGRLFVGAVGGLLALGLGTLLSRWLYGDWVSPAWNYFAQNLLEGKAAEFGTLPVWGYFYLVFTRGIPPLSVIYILGTLVFLYAYRRDPLAWMVIPFLIIHSLLSRKDVRFLFPLLPFLALMLAAAARYVVDRWMPVSLDDWMTDRLRKWTVYLLIGINFLLLIPTALRPVRSENNVSHWIYDNYAGETTIYYTDRNPFLYYSGLREYFYERPGKYTMVKVERPPTASCPTQICIYLTRSSPPKTQSLNPLNSQPPKSYRRVYSSLLSPWRIYELSK